MIRTFEALRTVDPGFADSQHLQLLRISIPDSLVTEPERVTRLQNEIIDKLAAIQGVKSAGFASEMPMEGFDSMWDEIFAEDKVYADLFSLTDEAEMGHIELSRSADLVVVAPATADLMAKAAGGLAGDLASTTLLATDKPVLMAPAMNVRMWLHPATVRNFERLKADGVRFVGPDEGAMACGEFGPGRMAEPPAIFDAIMGLLEGSTRPLSGKHVVVTAGPTAEPLDPVRLITNRSSGRQGYAIASALANLGAKVTLLVRGTSLESSMSRYLIDQIDNMDNVEVRTCTEVVGGEGDDHLEILSLRNNATGESETVRASWLFVFIGAAPRTDWLDGCLDRDTRGFVLTGPDLVVDGRRPAGWTLERDPYHLEASVPGVFVAGDVRADSVKRVASAVGEGAMAVTLVHRYLEKL